MVSSTSVDKSDNVIINLFSVNIPTSGMINFEIEITSHRTTSTGAHGGSKKYKVWYYKNSDGTLQAITKEMTDSAMGSITTDSLTHTVAGNLFTFRIQRDHPGSPGLRYTYILKGMCNSCTDISDLF